MTRYWVIAPFASDDKELFKRVWQFNLKEGVISIGWHQAGDISSTNKEFLSKVIGEKFPTYPPATRSLVVNMLWAFYNDISVGDIILARRGRKYLAGVGRVTKKATYLPGRNPELVNDHANFLEVEWMKEPRDKAYSDLVFPMHTLTEFTDEQFEALSYGGSPMTLPLADPGIALEDYNAFVLEKYLEEFIVSNFGAIFKGKLNIFQENEGQNGQQYSTDVGIIDILAFEPLSKSFVVIELKKGRPSDQVVGQVLRYMGWVKQNLATSGQEVRGLVICRESDTRLSYALSMVKSVDVRYYSVSFTLNDKYQKNLES